MCVIMVLKKGVTVPFGKLQNAVWNNPHGYGIVLKDNNLLEVRKDFDPKGSDPEAVAKILEDNKDVERIVHLRWKTEGALNIENTQPFSVYYSEGKKIVHREFMHNGTLYDYKNPTNGEFTHYGSYTVREEKGNEPSDSRNFANQFMSPLLLSFSGENGKADIQDPLFKKIIDKFWGVAQHNRGIIIANDQDNLIINEKAWSTIKSPDGEYLASNDDYFNELKRGYEYDDRKKREAETRRQNFTIISNDDWPLEKIQDVPLGYKKDLSKSLEDIFEEEDLFNEDDGFASLAALTEDEVKNICYANPDITAALIILLTNTLKTYYDEKVKATESKAKASKHIAELKYKLTQIEDKEVAVG